MTNRLLDLQQGLQAFDQNNLDEASVALDRYLADVPAMAQALHTRGLIELRRGRHAPGLQLLKKAVALQARPTYLCNLGVALREVGELKEAERAYRTALKMEPNQAAALCNLGNLLLDLQRPAEALATYQAAESQPGGLAAGLFGQGNALMALARPDSALSCYLRARELTPTASVLFRLSMCHLMLGNFAEGWPLYEHRWAGALQARDGKLRRPTVGDFPYWEPGTPLVNAHVAIIAEQGFGDTLQFARYLPQLPGHIQFSFVVQPPLLRLFQRAFGHLPNLQVVSRAQPLPAGITHQVCLLSLPGLLSAPGYAIPPAHYSHQDPVEGARIEAELPSRAENRLRVGLVWAGNPGLASDSRRSIPLAQIEQLMRSINQVSPVLWVSLQKDRRKDEAPQERMVDRSGTWTDFFDTAQLIHSLDLVIAVDTAVAHLAGACGKPVWLLNRFESEWRWGVSGSDSCWYPTVRQFRQPALNQWSPVLDAVSRELRQVCASF